MSALSEALNAANVNGWSAREIARRTDGKLSHSVVADYLGGREAKNPKDYVLAAFADVFPKLTVQQLRELAGQPAGEQEPYEPPAVASRLDARQRRAVDEMIRLLAARSGGEHGGDTAATSEPGAGPDNVRQLTKREQAQQMQKKAAKNPKRR